MSFTAPSQPKIQRALPKKGVHVARLYSLIDCGTFKETGKFAFDEDGRQKFKHELLLTWELPDAKHVFDKKLGPQPFVVSQTYNFSMGEKANLRKMIDKWLGEDLTNAQAKAFDISTLLGKPCLISVGHEQSKATELFYAKVVNVTQLPEVMTCPDPINPPISYQVGDGAGGNYPKLPEWIQKKVQGSQEWAYQQRNKNEKPPQTQQQDPNIDDTAADEMAAQLEAEKD